MEDRDGAVGVDEQGVLLGAHRVAAHRGRLVRLVEQVRRDHGQVAGGVALGEVFEDKLADRSQGALDKDRRAIEILRLDVRASIAGLATERDVAGRDRLPGSQRRIEFAQIGEDLEVPARNDMTDLVDVIGAQRDLRDTAIRTRQQQQAKAAMQEIEQIGRQGQLALSSARLGAAESGIAGGFLSQVLSDIQREVAGEVLTTITNREFSDSAAEADIKASELSAQAAVESAQPTPVQGPNMLQTLINIGGAIALGDAGLKESKLKLNDTSSTPFGSSLLG